MSVNASSPLMRMMPRSERPGGEATARMVGAEDTAVIMHEGALSSRARPVWGTHRAFAGSDQIPGNFEPLCQNHGNLGLCDGVVVGRCGCRWRSPLLPKRQFQRRLRAVETWFVAFGVQGSNSREF